MSKSMQNLFNDVGDNDVENISKIEVNTEVAKWYEYNKKREDLQKLAELEKKGLAPNSDAESETESESEVDDDPPPLVNALLKMRNKDPILKQPDAKLFGDEEEDGDE